MHFDGHSSSYGIFALDAFGSSITELHEVEKALGAIEGYPIDYDWRMIEIPQNAPFLIRLADASTLVTWVMLDVVILRIILLDLFV